MKISFDVFDKPPKKSQWGTDNTQLVIKLRVSALNARNDAGISEFYSDPVKLNLIVYAPNIRNVNYKQSGDNDPEKFVGDLDSFVAGVCDYLHKGPKKGENNFEASELFNNCPEIGPDVPLIIFDDSQIIEINAKKEYDKKLHYHVDIESI